MCLFSDLPGVQFIAKTQLFVVNDRVFPHVFLSPYTIRQCFLQSGIRKGDINKEKQEKDNEKWRKQENKEAVSDESVSTVQNITFKQKKSMFVLHHTANYQTDWSTHSKRSTV